MNSKFRIRQETDGKFKFDQQYVVDPPIGLGSDDDDEITIAWGQIIDQNDGSEIFNSIDLTMNKEAALSLIECIQCMVEWEEENGT